MVEYFILIARQENAAQEDCQTEKELTKISLNELEQCTVLAQKIEHMKKMVHTHQSVLDFDISFLSAATVIEFDEKIKKKNF